MPSAVARRCPAPPMSETEAALLKLQQSFTHRDGLDALLLMALVIGDMPKLERETFIGGGILSCLLDVGVNCGVSVEDLVGELRRCMVSQVCVVKRGPSLNVLGGKVFRVMLTGKKASVLERFVEKCEKEGILHCCPSMVQVVLESGARFHELHSHPSDFLIACRNKLLCVSPGQGSPDIASLVEVPNSLQLLHCFYVDWDMLLKDFVFLPNEWSDKEKLEYVRLEAMKTPAVICKLLVKLGFVDPKDVVQVVVVEGTRWHLGSSCYKASIHFVFKLLGTRDQYKEVWKNLLGCISASCPGDFDNVVKKRELHVVDAESVSAMGPDLFPLVGMDLHPYTNMEQGLALPFSKKSSKDPVSRPMCVLHIKGGEEYLTEVPCRHIWRAGFEVLGADHPPVRMLDPTMVLSALLDASICIPGPRCIGLMNPAAAPAAATLTASTMMTRFASVRDKARTMNLRGVPGKHKASPSAMTPKPAESLVMCRLPRWFRSLALKSCPDLESCIYLSPKYGSRPSCAGKENSFIFQVNKSALSICALSLMEVPFESHRSHRSNGTLYYVDGENVYVSCMKSDCRSRLLRERQQYCTMAIKLHKLIIRGERGSCSDMSEYAQTVLGESQKEFLRKTEAEAKRRRTQFDAGCSDHFHRVETGDHPPIHPPPLPSLPDGFKPVPLCRRKNCRKRKVETCQPCGCISGKTLCFTEYAALPPSCMFNSLDGKRTWILLNPEILQRHLASMSV